VGYHKHFQLALAWLALGALLDLLRPAELND
jgi:hypothetical protein